MNHNQDIAFNSIKIMSSMDSINNNSGSFIVKGGIGCKKSIYCKSIHADCSHFKDITCDSITTNKINLTGSFEKASIDFLYSKNSEIDIASIDNLKTDEIYFSKGIFEELLPNEDCENYIGSEDKRVNIFACNIKADEIVTDKIKSDELNLEYISSHSGYVENFKAANMKAETGSIKQFYTDKICPMNDTSQIGDLQNTFDVYSDQLTAFNGNFKVDLKTKKLIAEDVCIEKGNLKNIDIEFLDLEYGVFSKLLPENDCSVFGNEKNKVNIVAKNIDSDKIKSIELSSSHLFSEYGLINNFKSDNIEVKNLTTSNMNFNYLIPSKENSNIGDEENRVNLYGNVLESNKIKVKDLEVDYLYSELAKFGTTQMEKIEANESNLLNINGNNGNILKLDSENIKSNTIDVSELSFNCLIPATESSLIGNESNRVNIYSNESNILNIKSVNLVSDNAHISTLSFDKIYPKNINSIIGSNENKVNIIASEIITDKINSDEIQSNSINTDNLTTKSISIDTTNIDELYFNKIIGKDNNSVIGSFQNRINAYINKLDVTNLNGLFDQLIPINQDSKIGDFSNRFDIYCNKLNANEVTLNKFNGVFEKLTPADESSSIGDLVNRVDIYSNKLDASSCVVKKLEVLEELKVNKIESIDTFHFGKLRFTEGEFDLLLPENYNSKIGNTNNRFNAFVNTIDANFGTFNENLTTSFLKTDDLNVKGNICASIDYKHETMIKTNTEQSLIQLKGDIIKLSSNNDSLNITDDGIETNGLTVLGHVVINTNSYSNDYIYPMKSLIILTGNTNRKYTLAANKDVNNDTIEIKDGSYVKVVNVSCLNLIVNDFILGNDGDYYNFVYFKKWICLNKGNKYNDNTDNDSTIDNCININYDDSCNICSDINEDSCNISSNEITEETSSCKCDPCDVTYENNCE